MKAIHALILLLGVLELHAADGAASGLLLGMRGPAMSGSITLSASGPACGGGQLAWEALATASFATPAAAALDQGVLTVGGELLRGVPRLVAKGVLSFAGDLHGVRDLPLAGLSAIVLGAVRSQHLDMLAADEAGAQLANGDRVAGQLAFINDEAIGIDTGRRIAQVPRSRVVAVVLRPVVRPASDDLWLLLTGGDRLQVASLAPGSDGIVVQGPSGRLVLPLKAFSALWRDDARCVALAQRAPLRATASDRQGQALAIPGIRSFPGTFAGRCAAQGLELPARGEIAWTAGQATAFVAWVACAPGRQSSTARVVVDGSVAWEGVVAPGAAPVPLRIPLTSAREVALQCAAAPDGETAAQAVVWCHPTLVH
jgi:hypothetical protein